MSMQDLQFSTNRLRNSILSQKQIKSALMESIESILQRTLKLKIAKPLTESSQDRAMKK
jgi:hypothetical protein